MFAATAGRMTITRMPAVARPRGACTYIKLLYISCLTCFLHSLIRSLFFFSQTRHGLGRADATGGFTFAAWRGKRTAWEGRRIARVERTTPTAHLFATPTATVCTVRTLEFIAPISSYSPYAPYI